VCLGVGEPPTLNVGHGDLGPLVCLAGLALCLLALGVLLGECGLNLGELLACHLSVGAGLGRGVLSLLGELQRGGAGPFGTLATVLGEPVCLALLP